MKGNESKKRDAKNRITTNENSIQRKMEEKKGYLSKLNLEEANLHGKISDLIYELPSKIDTLISTLRTSKILEGVNFYSHVTKHMQPGVQKVETEICPLITHIVNLGDTPLSQLQNSNSTESSFQIPFDYKTFFENKGYFK